MPTKVGEICEFKYGKSLPAKDRVDGLAEVYGSNGVVGSHTHGFTQGSTIVVGRKGSVGEVAYSEASCWPIDTTYFIDQTATDTHLRWLFYALRSLGMERMNKAAAVPGLNRNDVYALNLHVPPIEEQRRFATILDKADAIRRKQQQALTLADDFLRSTFLEMFGDPMVNPKGWPCSNLEDLFEKIVDCLHTTPNHFEEPSGFPSLRTSDLQNGYIDLSTTKYVTREEYEARNVRLTPKANDIVYSREGERFGIAALIPDGMTACLGQRTMLFRVKADQVDPAFAWAMLNSQAIYCQAKKTVGGATSPHVNIGDIRKFQCILPSIEVQREFGQVCHRFFAMRFRQFDHLHVANDAFASISQRAFRGEL